MSLQNFRHITICFVSNIFACLSFIFTIAQYADVSLFVCNKCSYISHTHFSVRYSMFFCSDNHTKLKMTFRGDLVFTCGGSKKQCSLGTISNPLNINGLIFDIVIMVLER